jgi:hypothetical protein
MYYVYLDTPVGTELIGSATDKATADMIKSRKDADWEPGFMCSTRITERPEKETNFYD